MRDNFKYNDYRTSLVKSSWYRCKHNYGFNKDDKIEAIILGEHILKTHQEASSEMSYLAKKVIATVRNVAKRGDYTVLLTDNEAVTLESYNDTPESKICTDYGLIAGSKWEEQLIGTNGIGTAIASNNCLTINGIDHYANCLKNFTCTAAPIYGKKGALIGSLNISRLTYENYLESIFTHNFIKEAANQITANIFRRNHRGKNILSLSPISTIPLYETKALLAYDDNGMVIDATYDCISILNNGVLEDFLGQNIFELLKLDSEDAFINNSNVMINDDPTQKIQINKITDQHQSDVYPLKSIESKKRNGSPKQPADKQKNETLSLDVIAGSDKKMQQAVQIARRFLNKKIPILLLGETGVGKDVFSNALHQESTRANKPFVAFNCAAIPESLIDSELFGYVSGTFTDGLKEGKIGKIIASDTGTLFLDEIGDMPLSLQARLLRVLEDQEVTQLGSVTPQKIDLNIICATNKDIPKLIEEGLFREDLYFRIKGVQLDLPPLRARSNIQEITETIINQFTDYSYHTITITQDVWSLFFKHDWPGNIRELRSTLYYALAIMKNKTITLKDLPQGFLANIMKSKGNIPNDLKPSSFENKSTGENLIKLEFQNNKSEQQHILSALEKNKWNMTATAKYLEISRSTLYRKMQKHEILSARANYSKGF